MGILIEVWRCVELMEYVVFNIIPTHYYIAVLAPHILKLGGLAHLITC
jgi:hypothetical protein